MAVKRLPAMPDALLTGKLVLLGRLLSQSAASTYRRKLGLGQEEWRIVARLGSTESLPLSELGKRAGLKKSQISRAAAGLVKKGLLVRSVPQDDARQARLHLTASGRRFQQAIVRTAARRSDFLAQGLGAARLRQLHAELDRLLARAEHLLRDGD